MLLNIDFSSVENTGVKGEVDGKKVNFYMVINVSERNIIEAQSKYGNSKGVVAFNYTGNPDFLQGNAQLAEITKPLLLNVALEQIGIIEIQQTMIKYPQNVRVVFQLPSDFSNMQFIYSESKKYPNIRFEGGRLLRLGGCKIGSVDIEDIPRKIAVSRLKLSPKDETQFSAMRYIKEDDADLLEFYLFKEVKPKSTGTKEVKIRTPKVKTATEGKPRASKPPKPKKQLSSLLDLKPSGSSNSYSNF